MNCQVNVEGYVRLKNFDPPANGSIFPYVARDKLGVYMVNDYGNAIFVSYEYCDILP